MALWPLQRGGKAASRGSPAPDVALPVETAGRAAGGEDGGSPVRWPAPAEEALPAPGSASAPSSCVGSAAGIS